MLGGTVTGGSIANAAMEAFEAMLAVGMVGPDMVFNASPRLVSGFKQPLHDLTMQAIGSCQ